MPGTAPPSEAPLKTCPICHGYVARDGKVLPRCHTCGGSGKVQDHTGHQPAPDSVWALVIADMAQRDAEGVRKYQRPLQSHDGRDTLWDAYEEALDLAVYLRKAILERIIPIPGEAEAMALVMSHEAHIAKQAAEIADYERRWRSVAQQYAEERARRQHIQAALKDLIYDKEE